ncbi:putative aminopeptidase YbaC [Polycladomyces abyssicola]|uniref:Putative aminopeptidase YbaC n=1 Tax=Polycladomyces abyssicola TaxID=1125966 RepID=A0A8D5ZMG2_9BACL|nr:alpha/beta hydrolase [Polycladomyces abyssicola]BCU81645.1 putative aminopeptidase YbaC [Polycladomyces abyssicola]
MLKRRTPAKKSAEGIYVLDKIKIGKVDQWVMIRGANKTHPVLFFLHGGPGAAQIGFARPFQEALEENFVVVNWDQRGAGLSYSKQVARETMNIKQFLSDTLEVVEWVCQSLKKKKVYLVGHSWGTLLGMLAIQKRPDLFYAYYGVSQVVSYLESDRLSYKYLLKRAKETNHAKALKQLQAIGAPPWNNLRYDRVHQKWINEFGVGLSRKPAMVGNIFMKILLAPEYRLFDVVRHLYGQYFSLKLMQEEMRNLHLEKEVQKVQVPVIFCEGRHDYIAPFELAEAYYQKLEAPEKKWIWFEHSAHSPHFEEAQKFNQVILEKARYH